MTANITTIGIWGAGVVGQATGYLLSKREDIGITYYDKFKEEFKNNAITLLRDSSFIFLCLPTPMKSNGEISLDYIDKSLEEIDILCYENSIDLSKKIFIFRSTMIPGSTDFFSFKFGLRCAYLPEFLTEKNSYEDAVNTDKMVIGTHDDDIFKQIYKLFFPILKRNVRYSHLLPKEAEAVKYLSNIFLASQVAIANELYFICEKIDVDYNKVRKVLLSDRRIGTFTQVPGNDGDFGFGGKCFKKDMEAFASMAVNYGYVPNIIDTILLENDLIRKNKDWYDIPGAYEDCKYDNDSEGI